jgi:hypothetical protein
MGPILVCNGANAGTSNNLPTCNNICDLVAQVANVIYFAIAVVIWIVTPVLIAYSGIRFMIAGANAEMIGSAKKTITAIVIGIAIMLCAWLIVSIFVSVIGIAGVGGFGPNQAGVCQVSS